MLIRNLAWAGLVLFVLSCNKDSQPPVTPTPATAFTLVSNGGNCAVDEIHGSYTSGVALHSSNNIILRVHVAAIGTYSIATSTVNGFRFAATGTFTDTGSQSLTLLGSGTPLIAGTTAFTVSAGNSTCSFAIVVNATPPPALQDNDHLLLGNPSNAATITDSINNYLMKRTWFALSYSRDNGIPNWVSWHLYANDLGSTPRQDDFRPDNDLPAGWYRVPANAYSGSGFDRGHNVPSADRTSSVEANSSTFLITNMIPQAPYHNQQTWARMEDSLRKLVNQGFELYVIMGNYGKGGTGNNGYTTSIHSGLVAVPASIWKVAVVIPNGNNDTSRINANTRVIAVNIPNTNSVNVNWKNYRVSVDAIEAATGYDLLSRLPAALQSALEAKVDGL